jgi:hypothetical protein
VGCERGGWLAGDVEEGNGGVVAGRTFVHRVGGEVLF